MIIGICAFVVIALVIALGIASYVKAPPDQAFIITGLKGKPRILMGQAGFRIPFIEKLDRLNLALTPIDVKTSDSVPTKDYINVAVNANVNIQIGKSQEMLKRAAVHFLNKNTDQIREIAQQVLEGNMREIVGQLTLKEMVTDRQKFNQMVEQNAEPDLAVIGLEVLNFNVQDFTDENNAIKDLGVENLSMIQKEASISKAQADRDVAIARSLAAKEANDASANAKEAMAERNAQLQAKEAELKQRVDTQQAQADAAKDIEAENQRKLKDVAATDANIAKAEREAELKQKEIQLKEYELDALVRKQADAEKYAAEQEAEADRIRRQKDAEAKAYEIKQNAEAKAFEVQQEAQARKAKADADKYAAEQEAAGIAAKGSAEAKAILDKAEAQKQMGQASVLEMVLKTLPEMTRAAAEPLNNIDNMVVYGSDGGSKLVGDVMQSTNQIMEALKANGIDISALAAGLIGGKIVAGSEE